MAELLQRRPDEDETAFLRRCGRASLWLSAGSVSLALALFLLLRPLYVSESLHLIALIFGVCLAAASVLLGFNVLVLKWKRVFLSNTAPNSLSDRSAIAILIVLAALMASYAMYQVAEALTTGLANGRRSFRADMHSDPLAFGVLLAIWVTCLIACSVGVWGAWRYLRIGKRVTPNTTAETDAAKSDARGSP